MTQPIARLALILSLLAPAAALGRTPQAEPNVNTRYDVESVSVSGVSQSRVSQALLDDMEKLVGHPYDPDAANRLADRLRGEIHGYAVTVKVKRGERSDTVRVTFEMDRSRSRRFDIRMAPLLYTTKEGFSGAITPAVDTHHNVVSFGLFSNADDLLERNTGIALRYEHRKVGTEVVQIGLEYDYFHPSFEPETEAALRLAPDVPGIYRTRQAFSPSVSVLPVPDVRLTFGASFQTLTMQYPALHDQAANAFTLGAQLRRDVRPRRGVRHKINADYTLREATSTLHSDFTYTRQHVAADYTLSVGRQMFGAHFQGGHLSGQAPLFDRFSLGSATTLRGWDKFDVAPLGGTRLAYGSLEYRYRPFQVFYDFGTVWEDGQPVSVKHSVGAGLAWRNGFFVSLGVPLRYHSVTPVFMFGFRR